MLIEKKHILFYDLRKTFSDSGKFYLPVEAPLWTNSGQIGKRPEGVGRWEL